MSRQDTLFALFTTLYDEDLTAPPNPGIITDERKDVVDLGNELLPNVIENAVDSSAASHEQTQGPPHRLSKQKKKPTSNAKRFKESDLAGFSCFSSVSGEATRAPKRSKFQEKRRKEVTEVRKARACLRCSILKISVSQTLVLTSSRN